MNPGTRVGPYQIAALIDAGGMGEVYRARDTRLGRDVALKVLPRDLSSDPDRIARFEREARALAALNHRHIATIHGVEQFDGSTALVLELVEGETLSEHLAAGALPLREALGIAAQIAEALAAAHDKGIVHRDLKPANVKLDADGNVKVLDFGLAKMVSDEPARDMSLSPTVTADHTRHGQILGTAAYMSPEQARGQAIDRRTDVWAFGCVLYEMLTGRSAFGKATVSDTIAAVLERSPDLSALPPSTPRSVLNDQQRGAWSRLTFDASDDTAPVFSPDGSRVVFRSMRAGQFGLYVKPVSGLGSEQRLASFTDGNTGPQDWSSDGTLILYTTFSSKTSWDIGVLSAADGTTKLIIESEQGERGPRFSPDMRWIAYDSTESGRREVWIQPFPPTGNRWQVSTAGGISPQWRRDGKELFFIAAGTATALFQTLGREGGEGVHVSSDGQRFLMTAPPTGTDVTPITVRLNWRAALEQQ